MKSVDRDERKKPESHSPRQYNMNVWTAVLQKKKSYKYISFICGTFQSANNVLHQRLTFPTTQHFHPDPKSGCVRACIWTTILISTNTPHFTLFYLPREASIFHIIASHAEHIFCIIDITISFVGAGAAVSRVVVMVKRVGYIFGGVENVIKQFNLSKFNWKIFDVCVLPPNANEIIHWNK